MTAIECQYCGELNDAEEPRCTRCRRRLHPASPRPAPEDYPPATTATAVPALEAIPGGSAAKVIDPPAQRALEFQRPLFTESSPGPKVIPIPTLTPLRPQVTESSPVRRVAPRSGGPRTVARQHRGADPQQMLELQTAFEGASPQVDVIYCDAPVALPTHRIMAAAVDLSMVLISLGIFLGIFYSFGGEINLTRQSAPFLAALAFVISMFYRFLWCLADGETPGMRFAGLRLVDFDGRTPNPHQRLQRQIAGILSVLSAGLGLVWALVDEESLTWHDHISKTFPTPAR